MENIEAIISEKELLFCESWHTARCLIESMFSDFDNLADYSETKFGDLRLYQFPLVSDEALIDFETTAEHHNLTKKQMFKLKKNVGNMFCFGARKFGKTMCVEILDLLVSMLTGLAKKVAFASVDLIHIREVLDKAKQVMQNHPIAKLWERRITGAPDYKFELKNGYILNSVNFNLGAKNPGRQWYGKHVERVYIEEASLETQEVYNKRKDALSEFGAVFRISGMTDFVPHSPPGKAYYSMDNKAHILNLPQFVNPHWDEEEKRDRLEHYGGEDSIGYRVFVVGEVVEDGVSAVDMERVRRLCYLKDSSGQWNPELKKFEISKDHYPFFKNTIILERPSNADRIFISTDIGKKVTEVTVHSEIGTKYKYLYNVSLYNLTQQEIEEVLKFMISKLKANVIAIDCGDGEGRGIYSSFEAIYPKENLVYYDGSMKVPIDIIRDDNGNIKLEKGNVVYKYEIMAEWSVKHLLQKILYEGRCKIPRDYKFDTQFSVVVAMVSGNRTIYKCISQSGDHLWDTWKVFSIAQWLKRDFNKTPQIESNENFGTGAVGW